MYPHDASLASASWTPGDGSELPVHLVWAVLTGSGFAILLGTGLLAWWLDRRARRRNRAMPSGSGPPWSAGSGLPWADRTDATPGPGGRAPAPTAHGPIGVGRPLDPVGRHGLPGGPVRSPNGAGPALGPPPVDRSTPAGGHRVNGSEVADSGLAGANGHHGNGRARLGASTIAALTEVSREYADLRAAAARATAVAAQARLDSELAARRLDVAEHAYDSAREQHEAYLAAVPPPGLTPGPEVERDVARAALDGYRRGEISAEDLRRVWYGTSGWDGRHDDAEHEVLRRQAAEVTARQQYHIALATAQAARRAEYVAETAVQALDAEAAAAAAELAAEYDRIDDRGRRRWGRVR